MRRDKWMRQTVIAVEDLRDSAKPGSAEHTALVLAAKSMDDAECSMEAWSRAEGVPLPRRRIGRLPRA